MKTQIFCATTLSLLSFASNLLATDVFLEGKAGYFRPTGEKFEEIYGGGGIYGAELTCQLWKPLYLFGSADYFEKEGKSIGDGERKPTTIMIVPLAIGLKYLFRFENVDFYLGAAPTFTYIHFEDDSRFVIRKSAKWGYGAIAKAGALFNFKKHFFLDLFGDYSYLNARFHNTKDGEVIRPHIDLSSWSIGAGLGLRWGRPCTSRRSAERSIQVQPAASLEPKTDGDSVKKSERPRWPTIKKRSEKSDASRKTEMARKDDPVKKSDLAREKAVAASDEPVPKEAEVRKEKPPETMEEGFMPTPTEEPVNIDFDLFSPKK